MKKMSALTNSVLLKRNHGFTLLEILASIVIISVVLISIFRMQFQNISMGSAVQFYSVAPFLAQKKITEAALEDIKESVTTGDFEDDYPGFTYKCSVSEAESESLGDAGSNLFKFNVIISYNNGEYVYNLRSYKYSLQ